MDIFEDMMNHKEESKGVIPQYNIAEDSCEIYNPDNSLLCRCDSELMLLDILCQIKRQELTGYYIIKDELTYSILPDGRIDTKDKPPIYTKYEDYIKELIGF